MTEPKKEFYLKISDKSHKASIKYHPNLGLIYYLRLFNERGETISETIELPEEDYDVILSMFNEVEQEVLIKSREQKKSPLFPEKKVEVGSNTVTKKLLIPLCDDQETYDKAAAIEGFILDKYPELKSKIDTSKEYIDKEKSEMERQAALDRLIKKYPTMFKGRELSLKGIELIDQLLQPVYPQEEPERQQVL